MDCAFLILSASELHDRQFNSSLFTEYYLRGSQDNIGLEILFGQGGGGVVSGQHLNLLNTFHFFIHHFSQQ